MQQYLIFQAMLGRPTFTAYELSEDSGVGLATVRTTLHRNPSWVEEVGAERTGRRGGRWRRYRLTEEGEERARERLSRLTAPLEPERRAEPPAEGDRVPAVLVAAYETLLDQVAAESDPAVRSRLRSSAAAMLADGELRLADVSGPAAARGKALARTGQALATLRAAEDEDLSHEQQAEVWRTVLAEVRDAGDAELVDELRGRLRGHPFARASFTERLEAARRRRLSGEERVRRAEEKRAGPSALTSPLRRAIARGRTPQPSTTLAQLAGLADFLDEDVFVGVVRASGAAAFLGDARPLAAPIRAGEHHLVVATAPRGTVGLNVKSPELVVEKTYGGPVEKDLSTGLGAFALEQLNLKT